MVYGERGAELSEALWRETMAELAFANVEQIVQELSG